MSETAQSEPTPGTDDPLEAELEAFWVEASTRARFDSIGSYGGSTVLGSLRPPAWAAGGSPSEADAFVAQVLDESSVTTTATPVADYEAQGAPVPEVGAVSIVLDGSRRPRALIATSAVTEDGANLVEHFTLLYPTKRHR